MQIIHERGDAQVDLTGRGTGMNTDYWHVLSPSHVLLSSCTPQVLVLFLHSVFLITFMSFCSNVSCNLEIPESLFHICLLILILKGAFLLRLPDCWFLYSALVNLFFSGLDGTASIWQWTDFLLLVPAFRNGFLSTAHESHEAWTRVLLGVLYLLLDRFN